MNRLRVVIADDQPMMRAGFKAVLEATGTIEVVAEAGTGEEAVEAANRHSPDVVLMDIQMPGVDGIEATRRLPRQRVLILTTFGLDEYIIEALRAGASGFLLKDAPTREVVEAVRAVAAGLSNAELAEAMVLSEATVKTHVSNLLGKLKLRDRVQAVIYAYETGLISPADR